MTARTPDYFVVMIDYPGQRARESIVDPEITRREVVSRILTGNYDADRILFIHHIHDGCAEDITFDVIAECAREALEHA